MICPHCKKPIPSRRLRGSSITDDVKKKAKKLYSEGYSMRDIESLLEFKISAPTISRLLRERK